MAVTVDIFVYDMRCRPASRTAFISAMGFEVNDLEVGEYNEEKQWINPRSSSRARHAGSRLRIHSVISSEITHVTTGVTS